MRKGIDLERLTWFVFQLADLVDNLATTLDPASPDANRASELLYTLRLVSPDNDPDSDAAQ